ncbi:hypothetical protein [Rhodococcus opacus]|uniref:hypothetical protein n=1 Tax=Rhodococcus opacus TaxID=37919 RepID=UPI001F543665|nr:hypothetical protein [Rhodococcus opacus]
MQSTFAKKIPAHDNSPDSNSGTSSLVSAAWGNATVLGEMVFHAVERAGVLFGQMSQILYNNGYQEAAFEKYQQLADFPNG